MSHLRWALLLQPCSLRLAPLPIPALLASAGINTAIYSPSGANTGVGFAIPADIVRSSVEQIIAFGRVVRPIMVRQARRSPGRKWGLCGRCPGCHPLGRIWQGTVCSQYQAAVLLLALAFAVEAASPGAPPDPPAIINRKF